MQYLLKAQRGDGVVLAFDGKNFSNTQKAKRFTSVDDARRRGMELQRQFAILRSYKLSVHTLDAPKRVTREEFEKMKRNPRVPLRKRKSLTKAKAMRAPPQAFKSRARKRPRKNPSQRAQIDQAARRLAEFSGHEPKRITRVNKRTPKVSLAVGRLDGILYTTTRDGKRESYIHKFKKKGSAPTLAASANGKQLEIVGGKYEFTEAGIEDR